VLAAAVVVAAGAALFGRSESDGRSGAAQAASATSTDLGALVEQFSARSSRDVVRTLEQEASERPGDADVLALLGVGYQQLFRELGDPSWLSRSQAALQRSAATGRRTPVAVAGLAPLAVTQHRFEAAVPLAREALRAAPGSTAALGALADALVYTGRYRQADRVIDRMAEAGPSVAAYARVAFARKTLGRPVEALDAMELALEAGSGIPEQEAWARVQYGALLLTLGRVDRAAEAFRQAETLVPNYVHARAGMARVLAARGDFTRAATMLQSVVDQLPSPAYAIQLGDTLARGGRPADAKRSYSLVGAIEKLLAANGVRTELQTALFDLDHGRRPADALRRARTAYREAPSIQAADAIAWGLERTGRCHEARAWSQRALRLGKKDGLFLFHRGMIERCLGSAGSAAWFRRALAADPTFSLRYAPVAQRLAL
jgi:tetratricopeptide (TPR) repeat protein